MVGCESPNPHPTKQPVFTMHPTHTSPCHQHNRVHTYRTNSDSHQFFNLLTSDGLLSKVEELLPEHREPVHGELVIS